jgi:hypothetical protein
MKSKIQKLRNLRRGYRNGVNVKVVGYRMEKLLLLMQCHIVMLERS